MGLRVRSFVKHCACSRLTKLSSNPVLLHSGADIAQGMADVNAGHFSKMDMAAIKSQGRALKKTS